MNSTTGTLMKTWSALLIFYIDKSLLVSYVWKECVFLYSRVCVGAYVLLMEERARLGMFMIAPVVFLCNWSSVEVWSCLLLSFWKWTKRRRVEREKGDKITVNKCCFICTITSTYIYRKIYWKVTGGTVYAALTPMVLSHIALFVLRTITCSLNKVTQLRALPVCWLSH